MSHAKGCDCTICSRNRSIAAKRRLVIDEGFFLARSTVTASGCWEWNGALNRGYGAVGVGLGGYSERLAHRLSWRVLKNGGQPFPHGMTASHLCHNRLCVNPDHLIAESLGDNNRRNAHIIAQMRATHCPHGHEYAGYNLIIGKTGKRQCRTCQRAANARSAAKRRAKLELARLNPAPAGGEDPVVGGEGERPAVAEADS